MSSPLGAPPPSLQLHPRHPSPRRHSPRLLHPLFLIIPGQRPHRTLLPPRALSWRFFLPSASFLWDAIAGGSSASEASSAVRRGMLLFRQGDVGGSLAEFDRAIELDPRQKSYLWQRGLSLYYLNRFDEGAEQFRIDVAENPNDTEESIWCFLCEAQLYGVEEARRRFLQVGRDPRPFMREAYNMFKDGGDPEKLVSMFSNGQGGEFFYASLYAGLYYESQAIYTGVSREIQHAKGKYTYRHISATEDLIYLLLGQRPIRLRLKAKGSSTNYMSGTLRAEDLTVDGLLYLTDTKNLEL